MKYLFIIAIFNIAMSVNAQNCNTDSIKIKYSRAKFFYSRGNLTKSQNLINEILKADSLNAQYYLLLGKIYVTKKDFDKAKKSFNKGYSINKDKILYYKNLDYLFFQEDQYDSARLYINKFINIKPDSAKLYAQRSLYNLILRDSVSARKDLIKAAQLGDKSSERLLKTWGKPNEF